MITRLILTTGLMLHLAGCAVVTVVNTAVDVTTTAVGTAVDVTAGVVEGGADLVTGSDEEGEAEE